MVMRRRTTLLPTDDEKKPTTGDSTNGAENASVRALAVRTLVVPRILAVQVQRAATT